MDKSFAKLIDRGLLKARQMGVDAVEFFVMKGHDLEIQVKNGKVDEMKLADAQGIGMRVINKQQLGFSFSTDFSETALDKMLHQAVANARYNDRDVNLGFPTEAGEYPAVKIFDPQIAQVALQDKIALARATEVAARQFDQRVARVERTGYEDGQVEIWLANSNGVEAYQRSSSCGLYALALVGEGAAQESGYGMDVGLTYAGLSPEKAGTMAAQRAVRLLGAKPVATQVADLVLEPYTAMQILSIFGQGFSGEAVLKGKSLFADKLGQAIASPLVNLLDDGTLPGGWGTAMFDGEGVATSKTVLVADGVLENYLYNTYSAKKAGAVSTGNGIRGSYQGTPHIGMTNYYLAAGTITPEQLLQQVERGLYVTEIMGAHTANPITGDFSLGASGLWIEQGHLVAPVRGVTIAGNFKDLLGKVEAVADDLTFFGSQGAPTIKIASMPISGT